MRYHRRETSPSLCASPWLFNEKKDSGWWQEAKWQRKRKAQWERPSEAIPWRGERDTDSGPVTTKKSKVLAVHLALNFGVICSVERWAQCAYLSDAGGRCGHFLVLYFSVLSQAWQWEPQGMFLQGQRGWSSWKISTMAWGLSPPWGALPPPNSADIPAPAMG